MLCGSVLTIRKLSNGGFHGQKKSEYPTHHPGDHFTAVGSLFEERSRKRLTAQYRLKYMFLPSRYYTRIIFGHMIYWRRDDKL